MVRGAITRVVSTAGAVAVTAALALGLAPGTAQAAPKGPPKPTTIYINGKGMSQRVTVQQQAQPRLFSSLLSEVAWMAAATGQTSAPASDKLGPKYTLTVLTKTTPVQIYDLYPMAAGGPRAHRAVNQPPGGKRADAWFYGRLTMSETLRVSGVPLKPKPDVVAGGVGGGIGEKIDVSELDPVAGVNTFLDQMRRLLLLNGAVLVVILSGLAGIAFLIRRRV